MSPIIGKLLVIVIVCHSNPPHLLFYTQSPFAGDRSAQLQQIISSSARDLIKSGILKKQHNVSVLFFIDFP